MGSTPQDQTGPSARAAVIEIVGYVGAAIGLTAAGIVLGEAANEGVQILFDAVTGGALLGAGWAFTGEAEVYRRMRSIYWFLSVFLIAALAGTLFADVVGISAKNAVFLSALVSAVYSLLLWLASRRSLQALALIVSVYVTIIALIFPQPEEFVFGPPDLTAVAVVTWIFGGAVIAAGALGVLTPRKTTLAVGSIAAILGPLLFLPRQEILGEVFSLATAFVLVALGHLLGERGVLGLGIAGTLLLSLGIVANHVEEQGPAIAVLVVGLILVGGAIAASRVGAGEAPAPSVPPTQPPLPSSPPPPPGP